MIDSASYLKTAIAAGISEATANTYLRLTREYEAFLEAHGVALGHESLQRWFTERGERVGASQQRNLRAAMRIYGSLTDLPDLVEHIELPHQEYKLQMLPVRTLEMFVEKPSDRDADGIRDRAILALMLYAGLRPVEIERLRLDAYHREIGHGRWLAIPERDIEITLHGLADERLRLWIAVRERSNHLESTQMFPETSAWRIRRMARKLSVDGEEISPSDLRTAFILALLQRSLPTSVVALVAGINSRQLVPYLELSSLSEKSALGSLAMPKVPVCDTSR